MLLFLVSPCLVVAVQPCMKWIPFSFKKSFWAVSLGNVPIHHCCYWYQVLCKNFKALIVINTWDVLITTGCTTSLNYQWPSKLLLVQNQKKKHYKKVWNMFQIKSKDTRTKSLTFNTFLCCFYCWLWTINCSMPH